MNYSDFISILADMVGYCFPFSLIFGLTAKLYRLAIDFIFNKRLEV